MNESKIEVLLSSDNNYKELTVEVYCDGKFVMLLNQDEGTKNLKLEFPNGFVDEDKVSRTISLADFERGLELAKKKL